MDLSKVLVELRRELADLDAAIATLEQFPEALPRRGSAPKRRAEASGDTREPAPVAAEANRRKRGSV